MGETETQMLSRMIEERFKMLQALKKALPWMIRLGDFIGNGEGEDPMGRCNAILAMKEAIELSEPVCGYYCSEDVGHVDHKCA